MYHAAARRLSFRGHPESRHNTAIVYPAKSVHGGERREERPAAAATPSVCSVPDHVKHCHAAGSNGWTSGIGSNLGWAISSFGLNRSDSPGVGAAAPASAPAAHAAAPLSRDFGPASASSSRSGLSDTDAQGAAAAAPAPRPAAYAARASTAASPGAWACKNRLHVCRRGHPSHCRFQLLCTCATDVQLRAAISLTLSMCTAARPAPSRFAEEPAAR